MHRNAMSGKQEQQFVLNVKEAPMPVNVEQFDAQRLRGLVRRLAQRRRAV
jgi:hypothetical protein